MGAFSGINIPGGIYIHESDGVEQGPARYPGKYWQEVSNKPLTWVYGKPHRNHLFIGPQEEKNANLPIW